ncbi:hypothetical protein D3C75_1088670 [compost metagenome]
MLLCRYRDGSVRALTHTQVAHIDQKTLNRMAELRAGGVADPAELRRLLIPMLQDNRRKANTLEGYGVMNGSAEFPLFLEKGTFNRANVESLYLISDGLFTGAGGALLPISITKGFSAAQVIFMLLNRKMQCCRNIPA